jgi:hypothetical protein
MPANSRPFLQAHCCEKLGVRHVLADVQRVNLTPGGDILSLTTPQAGEIAGDLFVDCTGFKALLIGETLGVPFKECGDVLFCDRALAVQVPYASEATPIACQTISTRNPPAGSGTSACLRDAVSVTCTRAATFRTSRRSANCVTISARRAVTSRPQTRDPCRASRDVLEAQLRGSGPRGGVPRASRGVGDRAHRAFREIHRRAAARVPRGDGSNRRALQCHDSLSLGPHHRLPEASLRAHEAHRHAFLARQPVAGDHPGPPPGPVAALEPPVALVSR